MITRNCIKKHFVIKEIRCNLKRFWCFTQKKKKKDVLLTMNIHFKRKLKSLKNASNSSILNEKLVKENEVLEA
jgi:hypothetical protein